MKKECQMLAHVKHPRSLILGAMAYGAISRGFAYLEYLGTDHGPKVNGVVRVLSFNGHVSMSFHAVFWILLGLFCGYAALTGKYRRFASNFYGAMLMVWALAYEIGYLLGWDHSGWVSFNTYAAQAIIVLAAAHLHDPIKIVTEEREV